MNILKQRFDKITKVLCSSTIKMTLTTIRDLNGYGKLFKFNNGLKASVICHDGVQHNMDNNPIEVALITEEGILSDSIKTFIKVDEVNAHLDTVSNTPSEWWNKPTIGFLFIFYYYYYYDYTTNHYMFRMFSLISSFSNTITNHRRIHTTRYMSYL